MFTGYTAATYNRKSILSMFAERLLVYVRQQLTDYPFHNLGQLLDVKPTIGGTCFDHALKLKQTLQAAGYSAHLHEAFVCMTGELSHRLVRVTHNDQYYIVDTGSGWPTSYVLCPNQKRMKINVAGVSFKVIPELNHLLILRYHNNQWREMNRISRERISEIKIFNKFESRYSDSSLPYNGSLRLCWLAGSRFYRIAENTLYIYKSGGCVSKKNMSPSSMLELVDSVFPALVSDLAYYFQVRY